MVDFYVDADLAGEALEFTFPQAKAGAVAATSVRRDHEVLGVWIANPSNLITPAAELAANNRRPCSSRCADESANRSRTGAESIIGAASGMVMSLRTGPQTESSISERFLRVCPGPLLDSA